MIKRLQNRICQRLARHMPALLLYFCVIQAWARAASLEYRDTHPSDINWIQVCDVLYNAGATK